jgi:hypothetical protein
MKRTTIKPTAGTSGVALGSLGTLVFAVLGHQWDIALAVVATIAPGALAYLVANGGIRGLLRKLWGDDEDQPPAVPARTPRRKPRNKRRAVTTEPSPGTA